MTESDRDLFGRSLEEVLRELGIHDVSIGTPRCAPSADAVCSVGLTGDLTGHLLISTDFPSAERLVREMTAGMDAQNEETFGPFEKAVFGELGNQIAGRIVMHLADSGFDCNITLPTVITGRTVLYGLPDAEFSFAFGAAGPFGSLDCSVTLKQRKDQEKLLTE